MKLTQKGDGVYELDVKGYVCPYPQLYTIKSMEKLQSGNILEIVFDNPSSTETIAMTCNKKGYKVLEKSQPEPGVFKFKLQK